MQSAQFRPAMRRHDGMAVDELVARADAALALTDPQVRVSTHEGLQPQAAPRTNGVTPMTPGLSEWDIERMERARHEAELKMAAEWQRIKQSWERMDRRRPLRVVTPDEKTIKLAVLPSGAVAAGASGLIDFGDTDLNSLLLPVFAVLLVIPLAVLFVRQVVRWAAFRGGWTVHIEAPERTHIAIRLRNKEAAAQRMRQVAEAVEREGLSALEPWARRRRRRAKEQELRALAG